MLTAVDGTYAGLVAVVDTIKETSTAAIKRMKDMGLEVIMIIEDNNGKCDWRCRPFEYRATYPINS
ncbi:hypothetical protein [Schinkia azotoformans]|uniref:hypothetical protein n=1 Tax=Schinkia azotoformans TaxID=1454 RepID=UPI002DB61EB2|nr:hypothetical protein [Schinkia azotoformans]MEC1743333.1 hypothetical protein [Schinkia azotoformans]MEC1769497.1 hypothetical protein [Schinkia azotoformans]MEC1788662.1 hypothetical protein [Schinkia azotoformans]MED4377333.1 hypothetical protein [Schinkia azotoformans]MED4420170.1 hypothetical protein [Schinkia azotoformans]